MMMMLMFKLEKDMTLKSEAAASLKQQSTFLNYRQHVLLVLSCDMHTTPRVLANAHAQKCIISAFGR